MKEFELSKKTYIDQHNASLVLGLKHDEFRLQKASWVQSFIAKNQPNHVLDFGFGAGELLEDLQRTRSVQKLSGVDPSETLRQELVARNIHAPFHRIESSLETFSDGSIDLITCFNVLHHVPPAQRASVARQMSAKLSPGGSILIWEHNPFNPGTQLVVCRCEYDHDAILLRMGEVRSLFSNLEAESADYVNFSTPSMQKTGFFKSLEKWFRRVPLGAQYRVVLRKVR